MRYYSEWFCLEDVLPEDPRGVLEEAREKLRAAVAGKKNVLRWFQRLPDPHPGDATIGRFVAQYEEP